MNIKILAFLFILIHCIYYVRTKTILNAIAYCPVEDTSTNYYITNEFNEYSKRNNLNITINLNLISPSNSTRSIEDYYFLVNSSLEKKSKKYDIIFYYNAYTPKFEPHLLDLKEWLPESHIQLFKKVLDSELYTFNNKIVALPGYIFHSVVYNNMELLNKYNKTIPKTWDELLETGKYILEEEKKRNNTDILIYNGEFANDESGMSSLYEFMYSFRENVDDPFPDLRSQNAVNALIMMKKLKNEVSSDKYFQDLLYGYQKLIDGNGLFIKDNHINNPINKVYKSSVLPGHKVGLSGTFIGGDNIGINGYIDDKRKEAAAKAVMFLTSKDIQRKILIKYNLFSGIQSLYDEKEICEMGDLCEIYKEIQPVTKPISRTNDYYEYSKKFRYYIYKYLYGDDDVNPAEMLRKIDDITRIYYISLNSKDSNIGIIILVVYSILIFLIILSGIYLFIQRRSKHYNYFSKTFWFITLFGYILLICISYIDMLKVTIFKCHLKLLFQWLGFTFIYIPIFYKLISNFPEENKISNWVTSYPNIFISMFIIFDLFINGLILIQPYKIESVIVNEGKNFQKCKKGGSFFHFLLIIQILEKITIFLGSLFLIFLEWNLKTSHQDIQFCFSLYLSDIFIIILITIFEIIRIDNYTLYFIFRESLILLIVITNFLLYCIRVLLSELNEYFLQEYYIEKFPQSSIDSTPSFFRRFTHSSELTSSISNYYYYYYNNNNNEKNKDKNIDVINEKIGKSFINLMEYHYRKEIGSTKTLVNGIPLSRRSSYCSQLSSSYKNINSISKNKNQSQNTLANNENSSSNNSLSEIDITQLKK